MHIGLRHFATTALLAQAAVFLPAIAFAAVPQGLTEQGRLFDSAGDPLNATVSLTFSIYGGASGGTPLWTETQPAVTLDLGYFSAELGSVTPIPQSIWTGSTLYVGVAVNADPEMTPRQPTASVPYALVSNDAVGAIHPATVSVNGSLVIDGQGNWVGPSTGLIGPTGPAGANGASGAAGAQGATGLTGATGPAGTAGPQGPQGPIGAGGAQGAAGAAGAAGPQGAAGATGPEGPAGVQGAAGATGPAGATGAAGAGGAQGLPGATGAQGPAGPNGAEGSPGAAGPQGPAGADGATGVQGPAGAMGATGATGADGATGATGPNGAVGVMGPAGPMGPQGPAGAAGATGAPGAQGAVGATGAAGTNGSNGATGSAGPQGPAGSNGAQGAAGSAGSNGAQGAAGTSGAQGAAGASGSNGPQGATGSAGSNGAQGAAGSNGAQGAAGSNGAQGAAGSNGSNGAQGATGAAGTNGANGAQGATGSAGSNGAQGTTGSAGAQGVAGPQGTAGTNGAQGAAGTAGTNGAQGATGAQGPAGSAGQVSSLNLTPQATAPASPVLGTIYVNSTDSTLRFFNGTYWQSLNTPNGVLPVPASSVLNHFTFDNNTTDTGVDSPGTTLVGSLTFVSGEYNQAASGFSTSNAMAIDRVSLSNYTSTGMTFGAWVKGTNTASTSNANEVANNIFGDTSGSVYMGAGVSNGKAAIRADATEIDSTTTVADGNWHHLAFVFTYAGGAWAVQNYVDGNADGLGTLPAGENGNYACSTIGRTYTGYTQSFGYAIDSVYLLSVSLTSTQVQGLMLAP